MKQNTKLINILNISAIGIIFFVLGFFANRYFENINFANVNDYLTVRNLLNTVYYSKSLNQTDLTNASIQGMVGSLNDVGTIYLTPSENTTFNSDLAGNNLSGIGVKLGYYNSEIKIDEVLPKTPAASSPINIGDIILKVNSTDIKTGMSLSAVASMIQGIPGTVVTIELMNKNGQIYTTNITRAAIHVNSEYVTKEIGKNGNVVDVVQVTRFSDTTLADWESSWDTTMSQVKSDNPSSIIFDLRGNPGGYFDAAVYAASSILPDNTIVAYQEDRNGNKTSYATQFNPIIPQSTKIVVLVDQNTASAAEIFTGALQFYKRATVIGTDTFGKGTAQVVYNLPDGSALHVTVDHWLLPSGRWINNSSPIVPNDIVNLSSTDIQNGTDTQMNYALNYLGFN